MIGENNVGQPFSPFFPSVNQVAHPRFWTSELSLLRPCEQMRWSSAAGDVQITVTVQALAGTCRSLRRLKSLCLDTCTLREISLPRWIVSGDLRRVAMPCIDCKAS